MRVYTLYNKSKIYIKTLKTLLHVSITRIIPREPTLFLAIVKV